APPSQLPTPSLHDALPISLPAGTTQLRPGTRVEFGIADSRRGPQALSVELIDKLPSVVRATRPKAQDMAGIVDDLIRMLDSASRSEEHTSELQSRFDLVCR